MSYEKFKLRMEIKKSFPAIDCQRPNEIDNGRIIVVNDVTTYGGSAEYHCIPQYNRIGPYLRKCKEDGRWSGDEPRCECKKWFFYRFNMKLNLNFLVAVNDAQDESNFGTGVAIFAAIIVILLIFILIVFLHRWESKIYPLKSHHDHSYWFSEFICLIPGTSHDQWRTRRMFKQPRGRRIKMLPSWLTRVLRISAQSIWAIEVDWRRSTPSKRQSEIIIIVI